MSVSLCFCGIIEPTEEFKKKFAAFKACEEAGIEPPDELWEYFNDETPNPSGLRVDIESKVIRIEDGYDVDEIDLKNIRSDVTKIQIWMG